MGACRPWKQDVSEQHDGREVLGTLLWGPVVPARGCPLRAGGQLRGRQWHGGQESLGPGDPPELGPEAGVVLGLSSTTGGAFWRPMVSSSWSS